MQQSPVSKVADALFARELGTFESERINGCQFISKWENTLRFLGFILNSATLSQSCRQCFVLFIAERMETRLHYIHLNIAPTPQQ